MSNSSPINSLLLMFNNNEHNSNNYNPIIESNSRRTGFCLIQFNFYYNQMFFNSILLFSLINSFCAKNDSKVIHEKSGFLRQSHGIIHILIVVL